MKITEMTTLLNKSSFIYKKRIKLFGMPILVCFLLFNASFCYAQDPIFSQFYAAPIYLNPAFTGSHNGHRTVMNVRSHPLPDVNNISTFNFSFDSMIPALYGGVGFFATSDYIGNMLWGNTLGLTYAYHLQLNRDWFVNFGAQAGYYRRDIRWSRLIFAAPGQAPPSQDWKHALDFATGLLIYNDRFYGGLAFHHLNQPTIGLFENDHRLMLKHTLHVGMYFNLDSPGRIYTQSSNYYISPNIIFQIQDPFIRINYGAYVGLDRVVTGAWLRQDLSNSNTLVFLLGLKMERIQIGYSYDHSFSGFTDVRHSVHEISLTWLLDRDDRTRMIPRCPCF